MNERTPFDPPAAHEILARFLDDAATPWHAVELAAERLRAARFAPLEAAQAWDEVPEAGYVAREGSLVAWRWPNGVDAEGMRILGAHTDSPTLRLRPRPDRGLAGYRQLGVEVYGGALVNSWMDRDLSLAGRVAVAAPDAPTGVEVRLFHHRSPLLRVPQLAIHLDREIDTAGLRLDRQQHLTPVWGLGEPTEGELSDWLAGQVGVPSSRIAGFDVACVDTLRPAVLGRQGELFAAGRLDNLVSCFGGIETLARIDRLGWPCVVVLFDHEEVGSSSAVGAAGAWFSQVLERVGQARGVDRGALLAALPSASLLSADMAHATHPNYPGRHEPGHPIHLDGGPVLKHNVNQRYATTGPAAGRFRSACAAAGIDVQDYSHRGDLPCGSTIGPLVAAGLGVDTVDVGMPMLSMHSCRELMATSSAESMLAAFEAWFTHSPADAPAGMAFPSGATPHSGSPLPAQAVPNPARRTPGPRTP
jgi:aspartyl aminopeptidase